MKILEEISKNNRKRTIQKTNVIQLRQHVISFLNSPFHRIRLLKIKTDLKSIPTTFVQEFLLDNNRFYCSREPTAKYPLLQLSQMD